MLRPSFAARVCALFVRIRKSHVLNEERPSKPPMPVSTASHVSCTTSSATALLET